MPVKILDGKLLAQEIKETLRAQIQQLKKEHGQTPRLVNVMVGSNEASSAYTNSQKKIAEYIGIDYQLKSLPAEAKQQQVITLLDQLNGDRSIHGIMIQKPFPKQIDFQVVTNAVDPAKDVEGMNVTNIGKLMLGQAKIIPCTPAAVMEHLKSTAVDLKGKEAVIIGRSEIVGKPLVFLLLEKNLTVTVCHSATSKAGNLMDHLKRADVVVASLGKAGFVKGDWIKQGAIVIDVGINSVRDKIVGDVEFEEAKKRASFITPVPGGVGPVTVVMLMRNTIEAFKIQIKK